MYFQISIKKRIKLFITAFGFFSEIDTLSDCTKATVSATTGYFAIFTVENR